MKRFATLFLSLLILSSISMDAQIKSQWRGMNRDGKYACKKLADKWPADGPKNLWELSGIGIGHGSAAPTKNIIYITGLKDGQGYLNAIDYDGQLLWSKTYGKEWDDNFNGSRTTPLVDGNEIYLTTGHGEAICLNAKDGSKIWSVNLLERFGGENIRWGMTENPVIHKDKIYFMAGSKSTSFVALSKKDGSTIWKAKGIEGSEKYKTAYCSPAIFEHGGKTVIVSHSEEYVIGVDADNGTVLFSHYWPNKWFVHANTPIYKDGMIFITSGYGKGAVMLKLNKDATAVSIAWESTTFDARITGVIELDGYIYGAGERANGWQCLDWNTGKQMWQDKEQLQIGSAIYADGKLYCFSDVGEVALVKPSPEKFDVVSQFQLTESKKKDHWPHPVMYNGILFLRYKDVLYAYDMH